MFCEREAIIFVAHNSLGHVQSTFGPTTILGGDEDSANSGK